RTEPGLRIDAQLRVDPGVEQDGAARVRDHVHEVRVVDLRTDTLVEGVERGPVHQVAAAVHCVEPHRPFSSRRRTASAAAASAARSSSDSFSSTISSTPLRPSTAGTPRNRSSIPYSPWRYTDAGTVPACAPRIASSSSIVAWAGAIVAEPVRRSLT